MTDIRLLDWQMSRMGSPALDISYFMMTSTNKPLRDKYYTELLDIYYSSLSETVRACGSVVEKLFKFEDFQQQLRMFGRYGLTYAPVLIQVTVSDPDSLRDFGEYIENVARNGTKKNYFVKFDKRSRAAYITRMSGVYFRMPFHLDGLKNR